jgi:hypothetical protein
MNDYGLGSDFHQVAANDTTTCFDCKKAYTDSSRHAFFHKKRNLISRAGNPYNPIICLSCAQKLAGNNAVSPADTNISNPPINNNNNSKVSSKPVDEFFAAMEQSHQQDQIDSLQRRTDVLELELKQLKELLSSFHLKSHNIKLGGFAITALKIQPPHQTTEPRTSFTGLL